MGLFDFLKKKEKQPVVNIELLEKEIDCRVFDILQDYLPQGWQEVVLFAGYYKDDSGFFKYWIKLEDGRYIDCFNYIPSPKEGEVDILQDQLMRIHKQLKLYRTKVDPKQKWICCEMIVNNQGNLQKNYDYADGISQQNLMEYVKAYRDNLTNKYSN